jgi:hypothetical protein
MPPKPKKSPPGSKSPKKQPENSGFDASFFTESLNEVTQATNYLLRKLLVNKK